MELFQRIEHLIGKKLPAFPSQEEEVMMLTERVAEAQRFARMVGCFNAQFGFVLCRNVAVAPMIVRIILGFIQLQVSIAWVVKFQTRLQELRDSFILA